MGTPRCARDLIALLARVETLGVDADELGHLLWDVRETLATARSLMHVGAGNAYVAIQEFARIRNPDIVCHTSEEACVGDTHDVVVLYGQQSLTEFLAEYNVLGARARACLVLDVHGAWWWPSFKRRHDACEYGSSALIRGLRL